MRYNFRFPTVAGRYHHDRECNIENKQVKG